MVEESSKEGKICWFVFFENNNFICFKIFYLIRGELEVCGYVCNMPYM